MKSKAYNQQEVQSTDYVPVEEGLNDLKSMAMVKSYFLEALVKATRKVGASYFLNPNLGELTMSRLKQNQSFVKDRTDLC